MPFDDTSILGVQDSITDERRSVMKLYHHYKNKPYTYLGLARHSETLEEMVIYETRYENDRGKV